MNESVLERRLRLLFAACKVKFAKRKTSFADVLMDAGTVVITLPPGYDDDYTLRTLLHELTHKAMPGELAAWGAFEEDIIMRVIEPRLMHWLNEHPKRHSWWLKQLSRAREANA
jgi:hypothetical protein